jgi:hypothetical protein
MLVGYKYFLCITAATVMLAWLCQSRGTSSETSRIPPTAGPQTSPSASLESPVQNQLNTLRDVDFKNFSYPWYPSFMESTAREVSLQNGEFERPENPGAGIANLSLKLSDVSFVKLRDEDKDEAIVTVIGIAGVNRFTGAVFVYAIENGKTTLLWQHETGDRAEGGLRRIAVENRTLLLETYARSEGDGGLCCPNIFIRSIYQYRGGRFEKISTQRLRNENKNAAFLGYPSSSQ